MTAQSRLLFCRIVGKLAPHVQPTTFETRFISKAMALCQDTDYQASPRVSRESINLWSNTYYRRRQHADLSVGISAVLIFRLSPPKTGFLSCTGPSTGETVVLGHFVVEICIPISAFYGSKAIYIEIQKLVESIVACVLSTVAFLCGVFLVERSKCGWEWPGCLSLMGGPWPSADTLAVVLNVESAIRSAFACASSWTQYRAQRGLNSLENW